MIETCTKVSFNNEYGKTIFKIRIYEDIWGIDHGDEFINTSLKELEVFSKDLSGWLEGIKEGFT